jgi:NADH:ubiquinone oxidoreductase subunit K
LWFTFATILFTAGLVGICFNNKNFLLLLFKIEIMFLGLNLFFLGYSLYFFKISGYVYSLLIFGIVAAESALGLTLFFILFLTRRTIVIEFFAVDYLYLPEIDAK